VLPVGAVVTEVTPDSLCTVSPAGPIIDQQLDPTTKPDGTLEQHAGISDESHKAQTFTVDLTGQLTRIDAYIYRTSEDVTASLHIDVRRTAAGVPLEDDGDLLASATLSASEVPTTAGFLSIDVSAAGVTVTDGDVLALVLRSENDATTASPYMWEGAGSRNLYRQGSHFVRTSTYPTWTDLATVQATVSDLGFATVVTTDYAVVDCLFATVLSDDSNGVQIQVIAPAQPAAITNRASAYALEFDPDLTNNEDTADTLVGNAAPEIEVAPMSYDFGAVAQGTHSDPVEFCISNVGDADLEVSAIRNSNPSDFVLVANGGSAPCSPTRPFTLAPAAQCTFTVAYAPGDDESASGEATVESNDADEPAVVVTYSGTRQVSDGPSVSPPSRDDGGCNCTSERGPASSLGWLIVLLLVGQWRQRHQRPGKPGSSPRRPQPGAPERVFDAEPVAS
jgi:MYXO-CTERM domain-containing protein